ncbi:MAG: DUF4340 domain-containing protein [Anaerolineae bacterium]|nr:DUF4340 domain-containing protein [Anaerolineae bacterium]
MNQQRHRPWLPTVILAGIVALLVLFVIFVMPNLNPPPETGIQPTLALLWPFASEDLVSISVTKGVQTTTVERTGMTWRVVAPSPGDADILRVYNVADQVAMMRSRILKGDLADFGLMEPQAEVTLGLGDETTVSFTIGDQNPNRTDYYVQKEGDPEVHLVAASYISGLLDMVDNPPYPATPAPPPSPVQTETPEESPAETLTPEP